MVKLQNLGSSNYTGWIRMNTDKELPPCSMDRNGFRLIQGRKTGRTTRALDVFVKDLPPGTAEVDLESLDLIDFSMVDLDFDHMRPGLMLNGDPMELVSASVDGAAIVSHSRARVNEILYVDVWLRYYPEQRWAVFGECLVTASDSSEDIQEDYPGNLRLTLGDAFLVHADGHITQHLELPSLMKDGQAIALPFTFIFHNKLKTSFDWESAIVATRFLINGVAIDNLWVDGNPKYDGNADQFGIRRYVDAVRRLKTFEGPSFGVNPNSTVTGAQDDQIFVYGEAVDSPIAATLAYFDACKLANRPCHHLNTDGSIVSVDNQSNLVLWNSRVHWHHGVSPNRLGNTEDVSEFPGGWYGADVEHWLLNTLMAAKRLTGSPMLDKLLRHQGEIYRLQWTTHPGWVNTQPFASRAVGYEGINAVHIVENIEDSAFAEVIRSHYEDRVRNVIIPAYELSVEWDPRVDNRLGLEPDQEGWMPWQSSLGAFGLDYGCRYFGIDSGVSAALQQADLCVRRDWVKLPGDEDYRNVGNQITSETDPPLSYYEGLDWSMRVTWFEGTWAVPAVSVVLRHDPTNVKANEVWDGIQTKINSRWRPPTR